MIQCQGKQCGCKLGVPHQFVKLIKSFHEETKVKIRLNGVAVEEINVHNGLRQDCCRHNSSV